MSITPTSLVMTAAFDSPSPSPSPSVSSGKLSPVSVPSLSSPKHRECDYDSSPTKLYKLIEKKKWEACVTVCDSHPEQAATWVSRKERDGKLRWRLLPLHAAIVFRAPEKTIESILCSYPMGVQCKDDQGMLPIHLAFRNGASEGVVNLLLVAYPQSIDVKDRKGRIPLMLAQASSSPNKEAFIRALERGPSYYAVAAAATERAAVTAEQKAIFDSKLLRMQEEHKNEILELASKAEEEKEELGKELQNVTSELESAKGLSAVLTDHISALEAQLESRSDAERLLANKHKKSDDRLREMHARMELLEGQLEEQTSVNQLLSEKIAALEMDNNAYEKLLDEGSSMVKSLEETAQSEKSLLEVAKEQLEQDLNNFKTHANQLETQLKKKTAMEESLTRQLSDMATKLAESNASKAIAFAEIKEREQIMLTEKHEMMSTIENLTRKLASVASALDSMAYEQETIVQASAKHEESMMQAAKQQDQIVLDAQKHEQFMEEVAEERQRIAEMINKQARDIQESAKQRDHIKEAMTKQEQDLKAADQVREKIIQSVLRQKKHMQATAAELAAVLDNRPLTVIDEDQQGQQENGWSVQKNGHGNTQSAQEDHDIEIKLSSSCGDVSYSRSVDSPMPEESPIEDDEQQQEKKKEQLDEKQEESSETSNILVEIPSEEMSNDYK